MSLQSEIVPFMNEYGMVETSRGGHSGNILRETSQYSRLVRAESNSGIDMCEMKPGLYRKGPDNLNGITSVDDLVPLATYFFSIQRYDRAKAILDHITSNFGFYVTCELPWYKRWKFFIARNLSLMAHLHYCSNIKPNAFLRYWHRKSIKDCGFKDPNSQDEWILSNELIIASVRQDEEMQIIATQFYNRLIFNWMNGFRGLLNKYYNLPNGEEHPIAKFYS